MGFGKLKSFNQVLFLLSALIIFSTSSVLIVMGLKMNLNYWWRSDTVEEIEITVDNKSVSQSRGTDYYIEFSSKNGGFINKVTHETFDKFIIGESFIVSVYQGYYEGLYLTEEIK